MNQIRPSTSFSYAPEAAIGDLRLFSVLKVIEFFPVNRVFHVKDNFL